MITNKTNTKQKIDEMLSRRENVFQNPTREETIRYSVDRGSAVKTKYGCLATWNPEGSTGRSPKDTFIVDTPMVHDLIDWKSQSNRAISEDSYYKILDETLGIMAKKEAIFTTDRVIGADVEYALPVRTVTSRPLVSLFTYNMFRDIPKDIQKSVFEDTFQLLVLPFDSIDKEKYPELRESTTPMLVLMNFSDKTGIVLGSSYLGTVKKLMFTAMNFYLPQYEVLPLHCSANVDDKENLSIFLGLSGTGKTTLSSDPDRKLLGDDEHGWSDKKVFNFENGCYAKTLNLTQKNEPEIYNAIFHEDNYLQHGSILENTMIYPRGEVDLSDDRFTSNGRASYPLDALENIKKSSECIGAPRTIIFLTADASGVLPPISLLDRDQAKLWFLMGYTSKVAGTETDVVEPQATFSRFFGEPFMPSKPSVYMKLLGDKMDKFNTKVYLINTGWIGGVYGKGGTRISLKYTRSMVKAANEGLLDDVRFVKEPFFGLAIPETCPEVPTTILNPMANWEDKEAYKVEAKKLADKFANHYKDKFNTHPIAPEIKAYCPGL